MIKRSKEAVIVPTTWEVERGLLVISYALKALVRDGSLALPDGMRLYERQGFLDAAEFYEANQFRPGDRLVIRIMDDNVVDINVIPRSARPTQPRPTPITTPQTENPCVEEFGEEQAAKEMVEMLGQTLVVRRIKRNT